MPSSNDDASATARLARISAFLSSHRDDANLPLRVSWPDAAGGVLASVKLVTPQKSGPPGSDSLLDRLREDAIADARAQVEHSPRDVTTPPSRTSPLLHQLSAVDETSTPSCDRADGDTCPPTSHPATENPSVAVASVPAPASAVHSILDCLEVTREVDGPDRITAAHSSGAAVRSAAMDFGEHTALVSTSVLILPDYRAAVPPTATVPYQRRRDTVGTTAPAITSAPLPQRFDGSSARAHSQSRRAPPAARRTGLASHPPPRGGERREGRDAISAAAATATTCTARLVHRMPNRHAATSAASSLVDYDAIANEVLRQSAPFRGHPSPGSNRAVDYVLARGDYSMGQRQQQQPQPPSHLYDGQQQRPHSNQILPLVRIGVRGLGTDVVPTTCSATTSRTQVGDQWGAESVAELRFEGTGGSLGGRQLAHPASPICVRPLLPASRSSNSDTLVRSAAPLMEHQSQPATAGRYAAGSSTTTTPATLLVQPAAPISAAAATAPTTNGVHAAAVAGRAAPTLAAASIPQRGQLGESVGSSLPVHSHDSRDNPGHHRAAPTTAMSPSAIAAVQAWLDSPERPQPPAATAFSSTSAPTTVTDNGGGDGGRRRGIVDVEGRDFTDSTAPHHVQQGRNTSDVGGDRAESRGRGEGWLNGNHRQKQHHDSHALLPPPPHSEDLPPSRRAAAAASATTRALATLLAVGSLPPQPPPLELQQPRHVWQPAADGRAAAPQHGEHYSLQRQQQQQCHPSLSGRLDSDDEGEVVGTFTRTPLPKGGAPLLGSPPAAPLSPSTLMVHRMLQFLAAAPVVRGS